MGGFYQLDVDGQCERLERLVREALPLWDMPADARVRLIKYRENAVYEVSDSYRRHAMRVHRANYHSDAALLSELRWMASLDEAGVLTPAVIPALDGALFRVVSVDGVDEPRQVDVLGWVDGEPIGSIEHASTVETAQAVANLKTIGWIMARLHNQAECWQSRPADFTRHAWDLDGLLGEEPVWGRFWECDLLDEAQRDLMLQARSRAREALENYGYGADRYGLIHCDLLPENVMRVKYELRIIDFDDSGFGWHLFDVATSLFWFAEHENFDQIVAGFVEGYRERRELPDEQLEMLPLFFLLRALAYLGWVHTRSEMDEVRASIGPTIVKAALGLAQEYLDT
jgi:Ser/Thr protein kinase RdoA (MazF antagonist)